MNYRKLLMGAFLTSAICLVIVFGLTEKAAAWSWYGFSALTLDDAVRGPEGGVIKITLQNVSVTAQCFNINSGQEDQPGVGNLGGLTIDVDVVPDPEKNKGIVSVFGEIDMSIFDNHDDPDHIHICFPYDNVNKEELLDSAVIYEFTAEWVWYKYADRTEPGDPTINSGTDYCTWDGEIGIDHDLPFKCVELSEKNLKFVE
jgi:hypothetical protein